MEIHTSCNTIMDKTDKIISDTCDEFYNDKKKFIAKIKKDKKSLSLTVNSFLLKQKLYGLSGEEMDIFNIIKALK